ncbi:MAG: SPOR domain-containing protein [Pseudomonadota bacterium]
MSIFQMTSAASLRMAGLSAAILGTLTLSACDDSGNFNLSEVFAAKPEANAEVQQDEAGEFIEQDVEAPDVFSANEAGLWDGRPSLGGVWVAHPDVKDPERVMIRNQSNGQFVVGALFRREREIPGPRLQVSSDAAEALDMLAGSPVELSVVALRKERIPVAPPEPEPIEESETVPEAPEEIEETTLDPIEAASAAIEEADPTPVATPTPEAPVIESTLPVSRLNKPYIQVGIFSVEDNAERVATQMRSAGMVPTVRAQESGGKPFWRVLVGPAGTAAEQRTLLNQIKAEGYSDAYAVSS